MDKKYWEGYYSKQREAGEPSLFAKYIIENYKIEANSNLIELGCGNGRDSIFFCKEGLSVVAIDQVDGEINFLEKQFKDLNDLKFVCDDFTSLADENMYDVVYSRFTLHSINAKQQDRVLNWAYNQLNSGGLFCIEVRGQKNELYKKGTQVPNEADAYIHDEHYRRFLDFNFLCLELKKIGFAIEYSNEAKGFSPFNQTDETFIRVVARK